MPVEGRCVGEDPELIVLDIQVTADKFYGNALSGHVAQHETGSRNHGPGGQGGIANPDVRQRGPHFINGRKVRQRPGNDMSGRDRIVLPESHRKKQCRRRQKDLA
jgi:hypothetical protein